MKEEILNLLKQQHGWISGEVISQQMGITRSAVWKCMKALKEQGYHIESVTNKGYRLVSSPDVLTWGEIHPFLETRILGQKIYTYDEVDSTNYEARRMAERGAPDGSLFIAEAQNRGRGRLGRSWIAEPGGGIWMSLLLLPQVKPSDVSQITLIAGLAVCLAVRQYTGLPALIKWPNDVLVNGKKICGILTEMTAEIDRVSSLVVGIGINVNIDQFPATLKDSATSLSIESGRHFARAPLVAGVLNAFERHYITFLEQGITHDFLTQYKQLCATLGRQVKIIRPGCIREGQASDISLAGELVVDTDQGPLVVNAGEVSVRGMMGYQ